MARVMGITIPAGLEIIYNKTLRMYDISVMCNIGKNPRFFPRDYKATLRDLTYLYTIAYAWGNFSQATKDEWNLASNVIGQHSYNLYVQDKSYRIKNGIVGDATPSLYHQYFVGHINIQAPASSALIAQYNPHRLFWPASFEIGFKTNLVSAGANPYARFKLIWMRYITGQNIDAVESIELPLVSAWDKRKQFVTFQSGIKGRWRIELELNDVTGDIWFDDLFVFYGGEIKNNDGYCDNVVKWYEAVNLPAGVTLESIYPIGGAV